MSTHWRIRPQSTTGWTSIRVVSFDWIDRVEAAMFPVVGRNGLMVSPGRRSGLMGSVRVLVRTAAQDLALTAILKAKEMLVLESSLGHSWDVAVVGDIDRKQNVTKNPAGSAYPVKHEYFVQFRVIQITPREDPLSSLEGTFDAAQFDQQVFA